MTSVRPAAVAGAFYPAQKQQLANMVNGFLTDAGRKTTDLPASPKVIIAPHAGYIYSGAVAASAYARLAGAADKIRRVVIMGPCHRVGVSGLALSTADYFATPLGNIPLDKVAQQQVSILPQVQSFDPTHAQEHSLEVHLPFLQSILHDFSIVPLVVGRSSPEQVAQVLDLLWGGPETLIVISSDLSHFLDYQQAKIKDSTTCDAIQNLSPGQIDSKGACGCYALNGMLSVAKRRNMAIETLSVCNSGDTAGPKTRVVGYGAWSLTEPSTSLDNKPDNAIASPQPNPQSPHQPYYPLLLQLAAKAILQRLNTPQLKKLTINGLPKALQQPAATFVTLNKAGRLRGCIGSIMAHRNLVDDILGNATAAAFNDPRFPPLEKVEIEDLEVSISILSPPQSMNFASEADLLSQLRPGIDGLIISANGRRAVFLPQVWQQLPQPSQFLGRLKSKAGLTPDFWSDQLKAENFQVEKFSSLELPEPGAIWQ